MAQPFLGEIKLFANPFAPTGYAACDGRSMLVSQYSALFGLIGNKFGGDGKTNFALPDFRGRLGVGQGQGPGRRNWTVGQALGTETVVLAQQEMGAHLHPLTATGATATGNHPEGAQLGRSFKGSLESATTGRFYSDKGPTASLNAQSVGPAGGGQGHPNMMPFLALNHFIAIRGVMPRPA